MKKNESSTNKEHLLKLVTKFVLELNMARKKISFYPEGHPEIEEQIEKLKSIMTKIFDRKKTISLGIAKDKIFFEDILLDPKTPGLREFAEILFNQGVIFLTISSKVTLDELVKFFKRISQPAEIIRKSERLDNFMKKENIENIKLKMLEIAELPISEEEEILVGKTPKEEFGKENFWILLIKGLVIKYSDISNELSSLEKALGISPKKLAEIIDKSFDLDITKSPNFQEFMEIYFKSVRSASKYPIVNNEIKKKIEDFVLNLSSNKKAIFLIKNIEYAEKASPEERKLLRNLFDKTFLEVLKHAISQKEDLPEKILRLLGSSSIVNIPRKKLQEYIEKVRRRRASSLLKDFYRADDIVIYQPENYKKILDDFISQMEVKEMEKPTATDLEEFHQTLL